MFECNNVDDLTSRLEYIFIMYKQVFFCGSFPKEGEQPYGGGEVGNTRTVSMLERHGYKVIKIRKRKSPANRGRLLRLLSYPFRISMDWLTVFCTLIFASRKSLVHISGFAGKNTFNEYVLMRMTKLLGFSTLYELRGGGAISFWEKGSFMYRKMFTSILNNSIYIFIQGKELIPLIESVSKVSYHYYPNFVEDEFVPKFIIVKPKDRINLLFYGRLEEEKHVDMVVQIAAIVQKTLPNVYLTIVGNGKKYYLTMIKECMDKFLAQGTYTFLEGCKHNEIPELLVDKHFYIFPSTQPLEGQSNSVTECMSYGVVPIASPQGFNASTIGNEALIVEQLSAKAYANRIIDIMKSGDFEKYSTQVRKRFLENYTQKVIAEKTLAVYQDIMNIV